VSTAAERYRELRAEVPPAVRIVVVTKFHPAELVRELHAAGVRDFGESRHQEAAAKAAALADLDLDWHFVGQLQSNKARAVAAYASVVHSLDRESLLGPLSGAEGAAVRAFIQVNLTDDPGRGGVLPADLARLADRTLATPGVELVGLMAVAGLGAEPRAEFARVRELRDRVLLPIAPHATGLSMGMSGDYREALTAGATHLRIGTAITGNRPDPAYARG